MDPTCLASFRERVARHVINDQATPDCEQKSFTRFYVVDSRPPPIANYIVNVLFKITLLVAKLSCKYYEYIEVYSDHAFSVLTFIHYSIHNYNSRH